jgi:hypothetical protein
MGYDKIYEGFNCKKIDFFKVNLDFNWKKN